MQSNSSAGRIIFIFVVLLCAGGALVVFKTDFLRMQRAEFTSYDSELLEMVSVKGLVKLADLNLSRSEIKKLNYAALSHRETFPRVDVTLNPTTKHKPEKFEHSTPLKLSLVFKTKGETEVHCWHRTVKRCDLVPHVVRSMKQAVDEYRHYRDLPDRTRPLKRLYL